MAFISPFAWWQWYLMMVGITFICLFIDFCYTYKSSSETKKRDIKDDFHKEMFGCLFGSFFWPIVLPILSFQVFKTIVFFILDINFSSLFGFVPAIFKSFGKIKTYFSGVKKDISLHKRQKNISNAIEKNKPIFEEATPQDKRILEL